MLSFEDIPVYTVFALWCWSIYPDLANETRTLLIMVFEDYLLCTQICRQFIATKTVRS